MILNKNKAGMILGVFSILTVIVSISAFLKLRGPDFDPYVGVPIFLISSIIGIMLAGISSWLFKRRISMLLIGLLGLIANLFILVCTLLLLFAIGMGEA